MLLLEQPGRGCDGHRLQLELDGYEVVACWEPEHAAAVDEVAFIYLVLTAEAEAERWRWLVDSKASAIPILVFSDASISDLEAAGLALRDSDFLVGRRVPVVQQR